MDETCGIFGIFSRLARYPEEGMAEAAERGREILERDHPGAAAGLAAFAAFVRNTPEVRVGEIYTASFDLRPLCAPYIGHHLFGESRERVLFLFRLGQIYREHGHRPGTDLPDHIAEVLDFLERTSGSADREVLATDGLLPALEKMIAGLREETGHPYLPLFQALRDWLSVVLPAEVSARKEAAS